MKILILSLIVFLLLSPKAIYADRPTPTTEDVRSLKVLAIEKVYYMRSVVEDIETLRFSNDVKIEESYIGGRLFLSGTVIEFDAEVFKGSGVYGDLFKFRSENVYKVRFFNNNKILGLKTAEQFLKNTNGLKTELFYCAEGFPQQQLTKFLEGKLGKLPEANQRREK